MKRVLVPIGMSMAVGLATALVTPGAVNPAAGATSSMERKATAYAMQAFGYGSRVVGGDLPAGSGRTAFAIISCTNKTGLQRGNAEADVDLGGGLGLSGVKTRLSTSSKGGAVASTARHTIAEVKVVDLPDAKLFLRGISSTAKTWHDASGFHASTSSDVAEIVLKPLGEVAVSIPVPDVGDRINIPGVGSLTLPAGRERRTSDGALADLDAIKLHVAPTDTTVYLAHARSTIGGGVKQHLFAGSSFGTKVDVLEGTAQSGQTPFMVMPCQGTDGKTLRRSVAHANLRGIEARALSLSQEADSTSRNAYAWEKSKVAKVNLGNRLVVKAVQAKASVEKHGSRLVRSAKGTTLARVYLAGERLDLPARGVLRIPGIAKIDPRVVKRIHGGIDVTALRVTLLGARLAKVDIGHARARIAASGL